MASCSEIEPPTRLEEVATIMEASESSDAGRRRRFSLPRSSFLRSQFSRRRSKKFIRKQRERLEELTRRPSNTAVNATAQKESSGAPSTSTNSEEVPPKKANRSYSLIRRASIRRMGALLEKVVRQLGHQKGEPEEEETEDDANRSLRALEGETLRAYWFGDHIPGSIGFRNHGNTCFINAVLQCLGHTDPLAQYLCLGRYRIDLLRRNKVTSRKYGTHGEITEQLAKVVCAMWKAQYVASLTTDFKSAVEKHGSQYSGSAQHDAQEFFLWLLDKVHEDLNSAGKKKYRKIKDKNSSGRTEESVAAETLANHTRSNASFIHSLFQAQYRSSLTCPNCRRQSSTFDPFLCLSIPIPQRSLRKLNLIVLFLNQQPREVKLGFTIDTSISMGELRAQIARDTDICADRIVLTEIDGEGFHRTFADLQPVSLVDEEHLQCLYAIEMPPQGCLNQSGSQTSSGSCGSEEESTDLGAMIQLIWVNLVASQEEGKLPTRFGAPYVMQIDREVSYVDLQKLILKEMQMIVHPRILTAEQEVPLYAIKVLCGDSEPNALDPTLDHPLYSECVDQALALCDELAGPPHVKVVLEWDVSPKIRIIADDRELIEEHASVSTPTPAPPPATLEDCFQLYTCDETLSPEDAWHCPSCNQKRPGVKKMTLWSLPEVLVIHLKRFKQNPGHTGTNKLRCLVTFPLTSFDMSLHIASHSPHSTLRPNGNAVPETPELMEPPRPPNGFRASFSLPVKLRRLNGLSKFASHSNHYDLSTTPSGMKPACLEVLSTPPSPVRTSLYDLYAVCNHHGPTPQSGHYTAFCRNDMNQKWYSFDDASVSEVDPESVITPDAYILFYQRRSSVASSSGVHWLYRIPGLKPKASVDPHRFHSLRPQASQCSPDGETPLKALRLSSSCDAIPEGN